MHQPRRAAFTLLEVLLASVIAVLLFGGLYVAMQVELQQATIGREVIERSTVSRAVINRLTVDLSLSVTPPRAWPQANGAAPTGASGGMAGASSGSSGSGSVASGASSGSGAGAAASGSSSSDPDDSSSASSSSNAVSQSAAAAVPYIPVQSGVIGYSDRLIIFTTQSTEPQGLIAAINGQTPLPVAGDVRRISYWIGTNGGLCRQEIPWFTGDNYIDADDIVYEQGKSDDDYVIAKEISDASFEFYDINSTSDDSGWNDSWYGANPGPDGATPSGPPTAIRVTFTIDTKEPSGKSTSKTYKHVIPIVTSAGPLTNTGLSASSTNSAGTSGTGGN